jgi:hypothetical protein
MVTLHPIKVLLYTGTPPNTGVLSKKFGDGAFATIRKIGDAYTCSVQNINQGVCTENMPLGPGTLESYLHTLAYFVAKGLNLKGVLMHQNNRDSLKRSIEEDSHPVDIICSNIDSN